jgi:hypothetical protein
LLLTTPTNAWLRVVGIGLRSVVAHVLATGSNTWFLPLMRLPFPFSNGSMPPIR